PELPLGFEHAGGGPALAHVALAPALDVALGAADDLDHRLARVGRAQRLGELAGDPQAGEGERLLEPLGERAGGVGPGALELCEQLCQARACRLGVGERPGLPQPGSDPVALLLWQLVAYVAFLVPVAAMHKRALPEHVLDRAADGLAAVDDEQDRLLGVQAALDQIAQ